MAPNSASQNTMVKGRLNFSSAPAAYLQAHHIITLIDSQPALTQATRRIVRQRARTTLGSERTCSNTGLNSGQLAFGSPVSITNYIGQTGDGIHANWLERLNGALKEFNVPVKFDQSVTIAGTDEWLPEYSVGGDWVDRKRLRIWRRWRECKFGVWAVGGGGCGQRRLLGNSSYRSGGRCGGSASCRR